MRGGFTLIELVVVLVVMGLATALVAPALLPPAQERPASLQRVIADVQSSALRRGEPMLLRVDRDGAWSAHGASSDTEERLGAGTLDEEARPPQPFTLRIAPTGSCGLELAGDTTGWRPPLDLLTCQVLQP